MFLKSGYLILKQEVYFSQFNFLTRHERQWTQSFIFLWKVFDWNSHLTTSRCTVAAPLPPRLPSFWWNSPASWICENEKKKKTIKISVLWENKNSSIQLATSILSIFSYHRSKQISALWCPDLFGFLPTTEAFLPGCCRTLSALGGLSQHLSTCVFGSDLTV